MEEALLTLQPCLDVSCRLETAALSRVSPQLPEMLK